MLGHGSLGNKIDEIQLLEKTHLQQRVLINDRQVKLAMLDYELKKQKMISKTIEDGEIEAARAP